MALLLVVRTMNGVGHWRRADPHVAAHRLLRAVPPTTRVRHAPQREQLGAVFGSALAGGAAYVVGWRVTFMVLLVPIFLTAFAAARLREPERGESDRRATGGQLPHVTPLPFRQAVRELLRARTLRRAYWGVIIIGGGIVPSQYSAALIERSGQTHEAAPACRGRRAVHLSASRTPEWTQPADKVAASRCGCARGLSSRRVELRWGRPRRTCGSS